MQKKRKMCKLFENVQILVIKPIFLSKHSTELILQTHFVLGHITILLRLHFSIGLRCTFVTRIDNYKLSKHYKKNNFSPTFGFQFGRGFFFVALLSKSENLLGSARPKLFKSRLK